MQGGAFNPSAGQSLMGGPPAKRPRMPDSPQVTGLRQELTHKVNSLQDPVELASITAFGVVGAVSDTTAALPKEFVQTTMKDFSELLDMPPVPKFLERVTGLFQENLRQFMETTFHTELQQLLEALSMHRPAPQDHILRTKAMKLILEANEASLVAMRDLRKKPVTPPVVAAPVAASAPTPVPTGPREPTQAEKDFCNAALSGNLETVKNLLAAGTNINCTADSGWTALMNATLQGHEEIVRFLCDQGADLNLQDNGGFTAWMYACSYLRTKILVDLIRRDSNLKLKDKEGRGIQEYASKHQDVQAAVNRALASIGRPAMVTGGVQQQPQMQMQQQQQQPQQQQQQRQQQQQQQQAGFGRNPSANVPSSTPMQGYQPQHGYNPQQGAGPAQYGGRVPPPGFGAPQQFGGPVAQFRR